MRKRTLLTFVLIGLMLMISLLVLVVVILLREPEEQAEVLAAPTKKKEAVIVDPFAGREADAVALVQQHKVLDPAYVQEVLALRERTAAEEADPKLRKARLEAEEKAAKEAERSGTPYTAPPQTEADLAPRYTTVQQLIDAKYLEERFSMSFLERGNWRALHLETDVRNKEEGQLEINDDAFYEVYLDFVDGDVKIGPVWVVDIESGTIAPRNEMAEFFEFDADQAERARDILSRPERVVRAITNHKFESGIELGGVILLHFVSHREAKQKAKAGDAGEDRIVGWTVSHDFRDTYNAYFQWVQDGKPRVAHFRFDWSEQRLEPRGLNAIDLMVEGEERQKIQTVSIWPESYTNDMNIPREARWPDKHPCRDKDNKEYANFCGSFAQVLEQVDFIESVQWLLTKDENIAKQFEDCKARRDCKWEVQEDKESGNYTIEYQYTVGGSKGSFGFKVDPKSKSIVPDDDISRWAYFSVTPRT